MSFFKRKVRSGFEDLSQAPQQSQQNESVNADTKVPQVGSLADFDAAINSTNPLLALKMLLASYIKGGDIASHVSFIRSQLLNADTIMGRHIAAILLSRHVSEISETDLNQLIHDFDPIQRFLGLSLAMEAAGMESALEAAAGDSSFFTRRAAVAALSKDLDAVSRILSRKDPVTFGIAVAFVRDPEVLRPHWTWLVRHLNELPDLDQVAAIRAMEFFVRSGFDEGAVPEPIVAAVSACLDNPAMATVLEAVRWLLNCAVSSVAEVAPSAVSGSHDVLVPNRRLQGALRRILYGGDSMGIHCALQLAVKYRLDISRSVFLLADDTAAIRSLKLRLLTEGTSLASRMTVLEELTRAVLDGEEREAPLVIDALRKLRAAPTLAALLPRVSPQDRPRLVAAMTWCADGGGLRILLDHFRDEEDQMTLAAIARLLLLGPGIFRKRLPGYLVF